MPGPGARSVAVAERQLAGRGQHRRDPVPADHRTRQLAEHPADRADREGEQGEQVGHLDQVAGSQRPGLDPGGADEQHDQHPEVGQGLQSRVEQPPDAPDLDHRVAQLLGAGAEPRGLGALPAEGLDDQGTVEGLVRDLADLGAQLLGAGGDGRQPSLVVDVEAEDRREDDEGDRGEYEVGQGHGDRGDDEHDDHAQRHGQRREREPDRLHVGVGVGQQLPGGVALVPGQRQAEVLPGDAAAVGRLEAVLHDPGRGPAYDDARRP